MGTISLTALAASEASNYFKFSLEGRDDRYFDVSNGVYNSDWNNPTVVEVTYSNLNATNRAYLSVTGSRDWPQDNVMSDVVMVDGNVERSIYYKTDFILRLMVYLYATTDDDVTFQGYWSP